MLDSRSERILIVLRSRFGKPERKVWFDDSFKTLVATIISQNTAEINTSRAMENLSNKFPITPRELAKADEKEIEKCLKVAGLYRNKAKTIKRISKIILEEYRGDLKSILSLPFEEARNALIRFPGVGPKTADVVLLFSANQKTIPVDTHVNRVSKRLGLAQPKDSYEMVRKSLQSTYHAQEYMQVHLLLILLGRKYCKARFPLCRECPLADLCPSRHLGVHR